MDAKKLAQMSAHLRDEAARDGESAARFRELVRKSIARRAREIAERPGTPKVMDDGILVPKVAEWTDDAGVEHYVVYYRQMLVKSIAFTPVASRRSSGRKRSTHELYSPKLIVEHLEEHFGPLMD